MDTRTVIISYKIVSSKVEKFQFEFFARLSTRQHCRDNMAMFSDLKDLGFCIFTLYGTLQQLHLDTETLIFFEFFLVPEALLRCRCREAKQLSRAHTAQS